MKISDTQKDRIAKMLFSTVYPLYVAKVERKGRTELELLMVINWLTGYSDAQIQECIQQNMNFFDFFKNAKLHENANLITGVICGYRVEEIEDQLTQQLRMLDKLVDELAKGRKMEKILRG